MANKSYIYSKVHILIASFLMCGYVAHNVGIVSDTDCESISLTEGCQVDS